jgi:hypothetical protein
VARQIRSFVEGKKPTTPWALSWSGSVGGCRLNRGAPPGAQPVDPKIIEIASTAEYDPERLRRAVLRA